MQWAEIKVTSRPEAEELIAAVMSDICGGVSISDSGATVRGWIPVDDRIEPSLLDLCRRLEDLDHTLIDKSPEVTITYAEDSDWSIAWREFFHPFSVGSFRITPPWDRNLGLVDDSQIEIILEPGMAFGTGQHPTTELMLQILEEYPPKGMHVLDLGSGSGILSIAAAKLGAKHITAIEVDAVAADNGYRNIQLNRLQDRIRYVVKDGVDDYDGPFHYCVMNILADVIIRLSKNVFRVMKPGAIVACSGIIEERLEDVADALQQTGFRNLKILSREDWRAIVCNK